MRFSFMEKVFTLENVHGHYVNVLPVLKVFPKKEGFREDYMTIHVGWLLWILHIRLLFKK